MVNKLRSRGTQECPCAIVKQLAERFQRRRFFKICPKNIHKKSKNHWTMTIWTYFIETHQRYIATKFQHILNYGSGEEVKNSKNMQKFLKT